MKKTNLWFSMAAAACAVMINGCTAFGPRNGDDDPMCTGAMDDSIACTVDVCPASGGAYQHIPSDALCASGQMCSVTAGCVARDPACPVSCDDSIGCTVDTCVEGACRNRANDDACPGAAICRASAADGPSGCYTPPVEECSGGCDDGVACTVDACVSGACRHVADDTACAADQFCSATRGCVDDTDPPTGDFECVFADGGMRIGRVVRLCTTSMTGVRTIPNVDGVTRLMTNASMRTWLDEGDVPAGGCREYDLTGLVGGINTHPFVDQWRVARSGHPEWDLDILNVADFRSFVGRPAADVGLRAYVCQRAAGCTSSQWVELPEEFYTIAPDTVGMRYWSSDPNIHPDLTGEIAIRAVLNPGCDESHRPADL